MRTTQSTQAVYLLRQWGRAHSLRGPAWFSFCLRVKVFAASRAHDCDAFAAPGGTVREF